MARDKNLPVADKGAARTAAMPQKTGPTIQSVDRALDIFETLARSNGRLSLAEISARTKLNSSTCHHLISTILRRGYVIQDRETRRYSLGSKIFELSEARASQIDLVDLAMPSLQHLNRQTGEAIHLCAIEGLDLITLTKLGSHHAVKVDSTVSKSNAAHATATGKAILAWLPENEIDEILATKGMERFTEHTIIGRTELMEQLRAIRRHGYAEDVEEFEPGVVCIGAAIRSHKGTVLGSISLSLPTMRVSDASLTRAREQVMMVAAEISREIGHAEGAHPPACDHAPTLQAAVPSGENL